MEETFQLKSITMKKLLLSLHFTVCVCFAFAQGRNCPMNLDLNVMQTQDPNRYQRFINLQNFTTSYINNQAGASYRLADPNGLIVIPVVVHILHRNEAIGTGLNISDAQVQSQIDVLNEDFRRLNANSVNTPAAFVGVATDYNFEFRLACQDPNGNATNGITRTFTNKSGFTFSSTGNRANETAIGIKIASSGGQDPWPTDRYLNMWVGNFTDGTLGYATWPWDFATDPNFDGVVITTTAMGRTGNVTAPYNGGRTATHEIGHWLNLLHIWGDANCGDDLVADTPTQQTANLGCPTFPHRTCGNTTSGDMFMNYMDYSDDACMNVYSNGQRLRGRAIFAIGGPRAAFLDNYFRIQQPASNIICTGAINLTNPNCLAPTWTIVSGPAIITSTGTNQVTIRATATGTVVLRAVAGNYASDASIGVTFSGPPASNSTLIFPSGQRGVDPVSLCAGCGYNFLVDFVPGATSYTWVLPAGFSFISGRSTATPGIRTSWASGTYILYCSVNNQCGSSWTRSLTINIGSGGGQQQRIAVYPNPTSTYLTIASIQSDSTIAQNPSNQESTMTVTVNEEFIAILLDQSGSELRKGASEDGKLVFDVRNIKKGIYYLQVVRGKELVSRQILIDK